MITDTTRRKRINLMISEDLLDQLEEVVSSGERSDFVNEAVEEKLLRWSRRKAFELIEEFQKEHPVKMSDKQLLKMIHEDRRY